MNLRKIPILIKFPEMFIYKMRQSYIIILQIHLFKIFDFIRYSYLKNIWLTLYLLVEKILSFFFKMSVCPWVNKKLEKIEYWLIYKIPIRASNRMYIFFKNYLQCFKIHLYLFTGYTYSSILWMLSFLLINICYTLYEWHNGSKIYILGCFELWELKHLQLFLFCQILKTLGD